ncbi:Fasciclin-like arabinogalactan protein 17 [Heracleum sosnowskyi]|uniref:Fasciclin-like arabinogalactan protein 17 n=1 Tax=Heracleum sosnowskyi TaxID=360622 RepID=A0AAD8N7A7_9APIA|nr:Fasciclin-like arabinogalactan protein 17 [Heracleum sosnowskyi]
MTYHGITTLFLTLLFITTTALPPTQINSNSILIALLDSQYTELSELIEKALLLQTLEHSLTQNNLTIFAPNNEALQHDLDPEFKQFLLEPLYDALAPGPSLAPAPAPGSGGPHHHFDSEIQVKDFIQTLLHYGGYNEMADILVNLTSLASEMERLVSEGYVITVLAPNDEAMAKLTTDQLSEPSAPEQIMYYHIIPEYETEESMYNYVRRIGKINYDTLRLPHKVVAEEADGSVKFGKGEGSAYLFDPDIYTDGRISVQGIDGVLFPVEEQEIKPARKVPSGPNAVSKVASKPRRGFFW